MIFGPDFCVSRLTGGACPDGAIHAINLSAGPDNDLGLKIYRELAQKQKIKLHPPKIVSTLLLDTQARNS